MTKKYKDGYYWIKNKSFEGNTIVRPCNIVNLETGGYAWGNKWYCQGTYVEMLNFTHPSRLEEILAWEDVEIIPMIMPT